MKTGYPNYRYMALHALLSVTKPITFLYAYRYWALNSWYEGQELIKALDALIADGIVKVENDMFSLARPLTPADYPG